MNPIPRKELYKITSDLYKLLRHHSRWIIFKKLKGKTTAFYERQGNCHPNIVIDYRKEVIASLIHEVLHHWHPEWTEKQVCIKERKIMNALSPAQIKHIIKIFGQNL